MKKWWRKWTYELPLAFSDALWDICVVQFAAFLDRLTLRKVIEFIAIVILALAFAQTFPIDIAFLFAGDTLMYLEFLIAIRRAVRDKDAAPPPCVFCAEGFCWVHVPTLRNWLSLPALTNRLYPLEDIREGLMLLGFDYKKDTTRGSDGETETMSLWRGPMNVL